MITTVEPLNENQSSSAKTFIMTGYRLKLISVQLNRALKASVKRWNLKV